MALPWLPHGSEDQRPRWIQWVRRWKLGVLCHYSIFKGKHVKAMCLFYTKQTKPIMYHYVGSWLYCNLWHHLRCLMFQRASCLDRISSFRTFMTISFLIIYFLGHLLSLLLQIHLPSFFLSYFFFLQFSFNDCLHIVIQRF